MPLNPRMPAIFYGHGSPMNALEDNPFSRTWRALGAALPRPRAILCISAHWQTPGPQVTAMDAPPTIHDFGGFPQPLFDVRYAALGSPQWAARIAQLDARHPIAADHAWDSIMVPGLCCAICIRKPTFRCCS